MVGGATSRPIEIIENMYYNLIGEPQVNSRNQAFLVMGRTTSQPTRGPGLRHYIMIGRAMSGFPGIGYGVIMGGAITV